MTTGRSFLCRKHAVSQELEENKPFLHQKCLEVRPASVLEGIELQIVASRQPLEDPLLRLHGRF